MEDKDSHVLHDEYDGEDGRDEATDAEVGCLVHSCESLDDFLHMLCFKG